jgi:hypothetical protein
MIQTCDKLKTFQLILEKIGDHISFDSLYNASTTRRQTLEHVKLWGVLDLLPSMVHLGGAFTHFTILRSLEIDDMVLMGIPDDLDPQNLHEGWYFWTNVKPRRRLASMLPPTLESVYLNSQFAILCDHTEFLWDFVDDLAQVPLLRIFGCRGMLP